MTKLLEWAVDNVRALPLTCKAPYWDIGLFQLRRAVWPGDLPPAPLGCPEYKGRCRAKKDMLTDLASYLRAMTVHSRQL